MFKCSVLGVHFWPKYADIALSQKIANSGLDPGWIQGPFNYFEFVKDRLASNPKYRGKPDNELKLLFISACTWPDWREEFLPWRRHKEQEDAARKKHLNLEKTTPKTCPVCGVTLDESLHCWQHGFFETNEETGKWDFTETGEEFNFQEAFKQELAKAG